jgi:hypothetical protein
MYAIISAERVIDGSTPLSYAELMTVFVNIQRLLP